MIPQGFRSSGPCFVCSEAIAYGAYARKTDWNGRKKWEARLFDDNVQRAATVAALEEGGRSHFGYFQLDLDLERVWCRFVCSKCKDTLKRQWPQKAEERKRREQEERFRTTWRKPSPGEFPVISGRREFLVRSFDKPKSLLAFVWRTCLTQKCRGNDPAQRVGLWVKNRLFAHYYAWDFGLGERDLFGPGIAFWLEKNFQRSLVKLKPHAIWRASRSIVSQSTDEDEISDALQSYSEEHGPCIIHTICPGGEVYAQLRNVDTLKQATEFAWESLHIDIQDGTEMGQRRGENKEASK